MRGPGELLHALIERTSVGAGGCWLWLLGLQTNGYGRMKVNGRYMLTHRLSYELHFGEIPDGLDIHHTCAERRCCNPMHLEATTHKTNCYYRGRANVPAMDYGPDPF